MVQLRPMNPWGQNSIPGSHPVAQYATDQRRRHHLICRSHYQYVKNRRDSLVGLLLRMCTSAENESLADIWEIFSFVFQEANIKFKLWFHLTKFFFLRNILWSIECALPLKRRWSDMLEGLGLRLLKTLITKHPVRENSWRWYPLSIPLVSSANWSLLSKPFGKKITK